jgi:electron transport complex protein RnfD
MNNKLNKFKNKELFLKPYVYERPSLSSISIKILILLLLQIVCLFLTKSYLALNVIFVSLFASVIASVINIFFNSQRKISTLLVIAQGILIGMFIPENYPLISVFTISFIVLFSSKYFFEDMENAWINVVAIAVLVAWFIGSRYFPYSTISLDVLMQKNPSVFLIQDGFFPVHNFDVTITSFLNDAIFSKMNVVLPEGIISLLCDSQSTIPAFRFNLLTIIASVCFFADGSFSPTIPSVFIIVYLLLVRLFFPLFIGGTFNTGDILLALLSSGTLFTSVFLLQWFGTTPFSLWGKIFYGVIAGVLAFFIVGYGNSSIGMIYIVVLCNVSCIIIKIFEERINLKKVKKIITEI